MKVSSSLLLVLILFALAPCTASAVDVTVNPGGNNDVKVQRIGINLEMLLTDDRMWAANGHWMKETLKGVGVDFIRWGSPQWDWEKEQPLNFDFWAKYNTKDAEGIFGFQELIAFCKETGTTPLIIVPVRIEIFPEHDWPAVLAMARRMAQYVQAQGLATPVYFQLGNEPSFDLAQTPYEARLVDFAATIRAVNPAFRVVASAGGDKYNLATMNTNVGSSYDAVDFHKYTGFTNKWPSYRDKMNDTFFSFTAPAGGKESLLGECNVLWPDWFKGPMAFDLQTSLALLNGLCFQVDSRIATQVLPWPTQWPSEIKPAPTGTIPPYGMFNYDTWFESGRVDLIPGPIWAQRIVNENILPRRISGETTSDTKVRVFGYTTLAQDRLNVIVINKKSTEEPLTLNTTMAYGFVNAFVFKGTSLDDKYPTYLPLDAAPVAVGSASYTRNLPAESAVVLQFFNDASSAAPAAFARLAPTHEAANVSTYKTFQWQPAAGATDYRLVIASDAGFSSPVLDRRVGNQTQYQVLEPVLGFGAAYWWKVIASNRSGETVVNGGGSSFTTAAQPLAVPPQHRFGLHNGGFEEGFTGWTSWGALVRTSVPAEVRQGAQAGKSTGTSGFGQDVFGMAEGATFRLSAWARESDPADTTWLGVDFFNTSGVKLSGQSWPQALGTAYTPVNQTFIVPAGTWRALVFFWKEGTGTLFVDDVALRPAVNSIAAWRDVYFTPEEQADPRIAADEAEPLADGASNLMKYALGFDPRQRITPRVLPAADGVPLTLTYQRPDPAPADITYHFEASGDLLSPWTPAPLAPGFPIIHGDGTVTVQALDPAPGDPPRRFMRLRVTRP